MVLITIKITMFKSKVIFKFSYIDENFLINAEFSSKSDIQRVHPKVGH